jgi:hypothetical protein
MEEQAKYQTKMDKMDKMDTVDAVNDGIKPVNEEAPRTRDEQKILNTRLRLALRTGELPFRFIDDQEKHYRKIIYSTGVEVGKKFTANKDGNVWTVREVAVCPYGRDPKNCIRKADTCFKCLPIK